MPFMLEGIFKKGQLICICILAFSDVQGAKEACVQLPFGGLASAALKIWSRAHGMTLTLCLLTFCSSVLGSICCCCCLSSSGFLSHILCLVSGSTECLSQGSLFSDQCIGGLEGWIISICV